MSRTLPVEFPPRLRGLAGLRPLAALAAWAVLAAVAAASDPGVDPNLPGDSGVVRPANESKLVIRYNFIGGTEPDVTIAGNEANPPPASYLGFDDAGTWFETSDGRYVIYNATRKTLTVTKVDSIGGVPADLKNGSDYYLRNQPSADADAPPPPPATSPLLGLAEALGALPSATPPAPTAAPAAPSVSPQSNAPTLARAHRADDPNLPRPKGIVRMAADPSTLVQYFYAGDAAQPKVKVSDAQSDDQPAEYLGFNDRGTWLRLAETKIYIFNGTERTWRISTAKTRADLPADLQNGDGDYYAMISQRGGTGRPTAPPPASTNPRANLARALMGAPVGSEPATLGNFSGTEAAIDRSDPNAIKLSFSDADGKRQTYPVARGKVQAPGTATTDLGGWIYLTEDRKAGILFTVQGDGSLTARPMSGVMLLMMSGQQP